MIKICAICNTPFEVGEWDANRSIRKYCGVKCAERAAYERKKEYALHGKKPMHNVKCEVCGKIFLTAYARKVVCSLECQDERRKRLAKMYGKRRREAIKDGTHPSKQKKVQNRVASVEEVQKKAREAGMSYGQYMAMLYMQERGIGNGRC